MVIALAETFGRELSTPAQVMIIEGLMDVPLDALRRAVGQAIRSCKFMPSVAELREMADAPGTKAAEQGQSHLAWETSCAWLQKWAWKLRSPESGRIAESHERVPPLEQRSLSAIRRLGGMTRMYLALGDPDQLQWVRKDFLQEYELAGQVEAAAQLSAADVKSLPASVRQLVAAIGGK